MARIKKQGLDYFPLDTDFMHQRAVRRLMKQHGDRAFTVLLSALSAIYGGEGYYVCFNDAFCEDLSTELFDTDARQVEDVLRTAVKCGLFDERLCREHGILTSAHIQEQYLYSSKRRRKRNLDERYRLVETDAEATPARDDEETGHATQTAGNVTQTPENVTQTTEIATQTPQSKAQQSKAKQKETPPPGFPRQRGHRGGRRPDAAAGGGTGDSRRRLLAATRRRAESARRRPATQLRQPPDGDATVAGPAPGTVCHHPEKRLRPHRPPRVAGHQRDCEETQGHPPAGTVPAEQVQVGGRAEILTARRQDGWARIIVR